MAINPIKNILLRFVRRFYDEKNAYVEPILKSWVDSLVKWLVEIIFNGFVGYLALFGLTYLFPYLQNKIFLGTSLWHLPFTIILIGIVLWFVRETYKWFQSNKKSNSVRMGR